MRLKNESESSIILLNICPTLFNRESTSATLLAIVLDFWSTAFPTSKSMTISPLPPFDYMSSLSVQSHHIWASYSSKQRKQQSQPTIFIFDEPFSEP
jgi:hypothetical protein